MKCKLKDVCTKIGSGSTPRGGKDAYCSKGISLIRSQNVLDYSFSELGLAFINEEQAKKLSNVVVEKNDILLNITGDSVARACKVDNSKLPARVNQHVCIIRPNESVVLSSYILYYLQLNKEYLLQLAAGGATRKALTKDMISNMEIDIPNLENQRKIISILDDIQDKIEVNTHINKNLEEQAQAIFKSWFVDSVERYAWDTGCFSDIIETTLGGDWGKEKPIGNHTEMVYCIRGADIPDVRSGNKGKMPTRYILPKNYASKHLVAGDIVIEISGGSPTQSTGRATAISQSLLDRYDKGLVCTNFCRAIKPMKGYSMFVYYYWQYLYELNTFFSYENGTTGIKNLDLNGFLSSEEIVLPPITLVKEFDIICQEYFNIIFSNGLENEKLAMLRDTLLPRLMSGEIDVSSIET
ncbi:restriction endonuclease subunit S [Selenomonas ruminantium]|uniref:Type I restriction enzyme, S subunit n=1 Tax=Selenomonas ruminantium TaxID=971 RepID=A0A1H0SE23_SELRU|nr:restriction endonuclease subunit S [Selenomonas ruminantium]SDP39970.1 type I restriction enzyme, S subunit [Selenomonas ruminantium]